MGLGFSLRNLSFRWNLYCEDKARAPPHVLPTLQRPGDPLLHRGALQGAPRPQGRRTSAEAAGWRVQPPAVCVALGGARCRRAEDAAAWEPPIHARQRRGPAATPCSPGEGGTGGVGPGRAGDGEGLRPPCPAPRSLCPPRSTQMAPLQARGAHSILALGRASLPLPPRHHLNSRECSRGDSGESQACGHREASFLFPGGSPQALCSERAGQASSLGTAARRLGL